MKVSDFQKYYKNPRTLTKRQRDLLKRDLEELGDLSGLVHDRNSNEIIGGNQRSEIFGSAEVVVENTFDPPTPTGTVALGYVLHKGERYAYRQVTWTPEQCEKANIVANKAGGDWDMDVLANQFDVGDLLDWGFEEFELGLHPEADYSEANKEVDVDGFSGEMCLKLHYNKDEYFDVTERLHVAKAKFKVDTNEAAVRELLYFYERHA